MKIRSYVRQTPAAPPAATLGYFQARLGFETDCWDVHESLRRDRKDFVLVDVRTPELYAQGHVPSAVNIPHAQLGPERLADYPTDTLFVTYCAGPHCNGAQRAAIRLARLDRPVKVMIGGVTGWRDEGFRLVALPTVQAV